MDPTEEVLSSTVAEAQTDQAKPCAGQKCLWHREHQMHTNECSTDLSDCNRPTAIAAIHKNTTLQVSS